MKTPDTSGIGDDAERFLRSHNLGTKAGDAFLRGLEAALKPVLVPLRFMDAEPAAQARHAIAQVLRNRADLIDSDAGQG